MNEADIKLYLCSLCCRKCLWSELTAQEHRCSRCRLPPQACAICDCRFEPRDRLELYCKRCDFHLDKHVSVTPPPPLELSLDLDPEPELFGPPRDRSMAERWQEIRTAAGIEDDYLPD